MNLILLRHTLGNKLQKWRSSVLYILHRHRSRRGMGPDLEFLVLKFFVAWFMDRGALNFNGDNISHSCMVWWAQFGVWNSIGEVSLQMMLQKEKCDIYYTYLYQEFQVKWIFHNLIKFHKEEVDGHKEWKSRVLIKNSSQVLFSYLALFLHWHLQCHWKYLSWIIFLILCIPPPENWYLNFSREHRDINKINNSSPPPSL